MVGGFKDLILKRRKYRININEMQSTTISKT